MDVLFGGFVTGLLLSIFVGATFFMLIETSMTRGFRAALWFDLGVVLSDTSIIIAVYFFASWIDRTVIKNDYFNLIGGLVFIGFGLNYVFSRKKNDGDQAVRKRNVRLFFNGFLINLLNPSVALFWLGTMAISISKFNYKGTEIFIYYSAALLTMAMFDIIKAYFSYRLSAFIHTRILRIIYIFSGLLMIGLGLFFILNDTIRIP